MTGLFSLNTPVINPLHHKKYDQYYIGQGDGLRLPPPCKAKFKQV